MEQDEVVHYPDHDRADNPVAQLGTQEASIVDLIRADLQSIADIEDVLIPVAGYERTGLQIKYRLPESGKELEQIARRVEKEAKKDRYARSLNSAIDTMIKLCIGVYVQPPDVDEPVELDPKEQGTPVCFDPDLAEILGMNGDGPIRARDVVRKLFDGNDLAIFNHAEKLSRWLGDTKADLEVSFFSGE